MIKQKIVTAALISGAFLSLTPFAHSSSCTGCELPTRSFGFTAIGNASGDNFSGGAGNGVVWSGGVSSGAESVHSSGGSDRLVFSSSDAIVADVAGNNNGHIRVRDFIIGNLEVNPEADSISLGRLIGVNNLDATNIGNYLHVNSLYGDSPTAWFGGSVIFINIDGDYSTTDRAMLDSGGFAGGYGTDLMIELQGKQGNNNLEYITDHADNTVEQFQSLIDMGFLELSLTDIYGSDTGDNLEGTSADERFFSGGAAIYVESVRGNGGTDTLVLQEGDAYLPDVANDAYSHYRIRDFIIDDVTLNPDADSVSLGDLVGNLTTSEAMAKIHVVSTLFGWATNRSAIFINVDGEFTAADRAALDANVSAGGFGADFYLEFQGQAQNNNLEVLTGYADNSVDQIQTLIDWGFLNFN